MFWPDVTYMNQNMKMAKTTPTAASTMTKKVTPPAMAPELLPGASVGGIPSAKSTLSEKGYKRYSLTNY